MLDHIVDYPSPTVADWVIADRNGVGAEDVRRGDLQAEVNIGQRRGATAEELAGSQELKAKVWGLGDDRHTLRPATVFFAVEFDP